MNDVVREVGQDETDPFHDAPLGRLVFERTYARPTPYGRKETWHECVQRVVDGNLSLVSPAHIEPAERERLLYLIGNRIAIPAGRHLWASGTTSHALQNCFSYDTPVHTKSGVCPIGSLSGVHEVLSQDGVYRKADFQSFGIQRIFELELVSGEVFSTTADHEWITRYGTRVETQNLKPGQRLPYTLPARPEKNDDYRTGVAHGIIFGDGSRSKKGATSNINLQPGDYAVIDWLRPFAKKEISHPGKDIYLSGFPYEWKALPLDTASSSYWYGFVTGLLSADGGVYDDGKVQIYNKSKETLEAVSRGAALAGFHCRMPYLYREISPFDGSDKPLYALSISKWSVSDEDFIHPKQIGVLTHRVYKTPQRLVSVKEIRDTGRYQEVFCAVEPETHTIVVGSGVLTGQCFRAGWSHGFASHAAFVFDQLMRGGGVGANYSSSYFAGMPEFLSRVIPRFQCHDIHQDIQNMLDHGLFTRSLDDPEPTVRVQVEDSREGWVEALETLIWHSLHSIPVTLLYDVSHVRPAGSPIVGFGGTAAGPMPLMQMLQQVADLLNNQRGKPPTPLFAMEIDHAIADCVVAGNVRRSARMAIVHWQDPEIFEFIHCKEDDKSHWSTNISVEIDHSFFQALEDEDQHANDVLDHVIQGMLLNGEPGIYNSDLAAQGETGDVRATNPCGELALEEWESCILGHVNLAKGTERERMEAFRLMARFLVRTTCAPIQDKKQREVVERNRRIGVGWFGLQEFMAKEGWSYNDDLDTLIPLGNRMQVWKHTVRRYADEYADEMGIPRPIKVTTVAPTGTIAKLAGTTEGVQPIFARHFVRRVRYADTDPSLPTKYPTEPCVYTQNTTVVSIPCEDPVVARVNGKEHLLVDAAELTVDNALRLQALIQDRYTDNSISHTINVVPGAVQPAELRRALLTYLPRLKGTTIMVDKTRRQTPYVRITKDEYLALVQPEDVIYSESDDSLLEGCASGACPIK